MKSLKFAALLLVTMLVATPLMAAEKDTIVFGVHPFKSPKKLVKMFKPVADHVGAALGKEVRLVVSQSYEELEQMYKNGQVDFGYMGPALYAKVGEDLNLQPLARIKVKGKGTFQGVVVVKENSPIKSLADLKSKSFAFGDPASTLSHYVPHAMMMQQGVMLPDLEKYAFVGSHDNVAINVLNGNFTAGGLKPGVAKNYLDKGLRVLAQSEPVPEHIFVASPKLDAKTYNGIKVAIFNASEPLKSIKKSIDGVENAQYADYAELKKLMSEVDNTDPAKTK
ncbi:MAG: phosphate/phosphite/phosphonate ABC transporter substrate-binding protein [Desulfuromonadales bacterium]|nr:phosphate/phosphite/phosphonate ABC transporter substrate-binding protein [Desulfuromonadales bacterium]